MNRQSLNRQSLNRQSLNRQASIRLNRQCCIGRPTIRLRSPYGLIVAATIWAIPAAAQEDVASPATANLEASQNTSVQGSNPVPDSAAPMNVATGQALAAEQNAAAEGVGEIPTREEYERELKRRIDVFRASRDQLALAIGDQRAVYIRYLNEEDRSRQARETFYELRTRVRELMDKVYLDALDVVRIGVDEEAAQFMVTMIGHRMEHDIYDAPTLEGAARLIDGGSRLTVLFEAAARSAVVVGEFTMAKQILDAIDDEQMTEIDATLEYNLADYEKMFEEERMIREKEEREDRLPRVLLTTTQGDVVLELFLDQAPSTVSNFIQLVESGFYDGLDFYQVIDHLLALTGDPTGGAGGGSQRYLIDEHSRPDARKAFRGSLLMAKLPMNESGSYFPNSASSQFAILFLPMVSASVEQTVFGRVIEGMDAISRMRRVDPSKKKGKETVVVPPDMIIEATVIRRPESLPRPLYVDILQPQN